MDRMIECVPNFSEGRDRKVIDAIVAAICGDVAGETGVKCSGEDNVETSPNGSGKDNEGTRMKCSGEDNVETGVKLLGVDVGEAANRTVVTFAGSPEAVVEGAFRGVKRAAELIDMRLHHGVHPRLGATDVLPIVPVTGITLEECAVLARDLARRIYTELGIPCYCYEASALRPEFRNLAVCRSGEYESLEAKIADPARRPDFGPETMTETARRSGATTVGARNFLVAVNFNLNTTSADIANEIAKDVRESGRARRDPETGKVLRDEQGKTLRIPGTLKGCKAIGWYIEEYGIAQVSMNITDLSRTSLFGAWDEVSRAAERRGLKVTGTEIIGLVPERALTSAGMHFLPHPKSSYVEISADYLIRQAVRGMHLDELRPFDPDKKVIEHFK